MISGIGKNVYILGIGGISLSAMAIILETKGHKVAGYDRQKSKLTQELKEFGINVDYKLNDLDGIDTVIFSSAFDEHLDKLERARKMGITVLTRAEALKLISDDYGMVVAVSGSHGKTTTTAMLSNLLTCSRFGFTSHVGGEMVNNGKNYCINGQDVFLTEACEYKRNFLTLSPNISVILNMGLDHTDCYPTENDLLDAFISFANNTKDVLIVNKDDIKTKELLKRINKNKKILMFSLVDEFNDCFGKIIKNKDGKIEFEVFIKGEFFDKFIINSSGEHNVYNALASILTGLVLGLKTENIKTGLETFLGVKRRYENIGKINGASVILDYAHHPEEIEKLIDQAKKETSGKVYVVFQPHTYSRTKYFWSDFIRVLGKADSLVMYPIYPAREKEIRGVSSKRLAEDMRRMGKVCYYNNSFEEIKTYLEYFVKAEDKILIVGAGDIENFRNFI